MLIVLFIIVLLMTIAGIFIIEKDDSYESEENGATMMFVGRIYRINYSFSNNI
jgi:hypothetical protein